MKSSKSTIARVYITEGNNLLNTITTYLKDDAKIRGLSVFRAIYGSGDNGPHKPSLANLFLDLPLVIEFSDNSQKIEKAINHLSSIVKSEHIVFWDITTNNSK